MLCLYADDYGPVDPTFDPFAGNGQLIKGFEAHVYELAQARNRGQLDAMERKIQRGEEIVWCDQGYSWAYDRHPAQFFEIIMIAVILPYFVLRVLPRIGRMAGVFSPRPRRSKSTWDQDNASGSKMDLRGDLL